MISICNLMKKFDSTVILENFSYEAKDGSICGIIGYNGAGKTTLLKTIAGIYRAEEGEILVNGENIYENEILKRQLFMVQDDPYFLPQASIASMARLYKGYYPSFNTTTCKRLSEIFGLDPYAKLNGFSKGMLRQAALILGLSALPKYLLLDESFDGLDLTKRNLVRDILLEYIKTRAANIVISSHNLREMEGLCDYIGIIKDRHLAYASSVEEMRKKRTKFSITFANETDISILNDKNIKQFSKKGCTCTFLYDGDAEIIKALLKPLSNVHIENVPMTLEEIFLEESEERTYDFKGLF